MRFILPRPHAFSWRAVSLETFENQRERQSMSDERREDATRADASRDNEENELEAEQESAEAMDAEVPQPDESPQSE